MHPGHRRPGSGADGPVQGAADLSWVAITGNRLAEMPGVVAVAEPTSMTWLALSVALRDAGCDLSLLGARHAARLRGAITGKYKSDVIDGRAIRSG